MEPLLTTNAERGRVDEAYDWAASRPFYDPGLNGSRHGYVGNVARWPASGLSKDFFALCHSVMAPPVCRSHVSLYRLLFCCCVLCPRQPPNEAVDNRHCFPNGRTTTYQNSLKGYAVLDIATRGKMNENRVIIVSGFWKASDVCDVDLDYSRL